MILLKTCIALKRRGLYRIVTLCFKNALIQKAESIAGSNCPRSQHEDYVVFLSFLWTYSTRNRIRTSSTSITMSEYFKDSLRRAYSSSNLRWFEAVAFPKMLAPDSIDQNLSHSVHKVRILERCLAFLQSGLDGINVIATAKSHQQGINKSFISETLLSTFWDKPKRRSLSTPKHQEDPRLNLLLLSKIWVQVVQQQLSFFAR